MTGGFRPADLAVAAVAVVAAIAAVVAVAARVNPQPAGIEFAARPEAEGGPAPASAAGAPDAEVEPGTAPTSLAQTPDPTWQTNGVVEAIVYAGDIVVVGGEFSAIRPPGGDGAEVPRHNLAAFSAATGEPLSWNPDPDRAVRSLAVTRDGRTVFVGGEFNTVAGVRRRNLAALDLRSGAPIGFAPQVDAKVRALALSPDSTTLYLGGRFTAVDGQPRTGLAAVRTVDGVLLPWAPSVTHPARPDLVNVTALAPADDGSALFVGGTFTHADRLPRNGAARVDPVSGAVDPAWDAGLEPRTPDLQAQVYDIAVTADGVHLCGDFQRVHGEPSPNLVRVDAATGARSAGWVATTDGGVNSCATSGEWLYIGGHFQRAGGANADFKTNPEPTGEPRLHLAAVSLSTGELGPWDPGADSVPGVFAVAVKEGTADDPARVGVGGAFSRTGGFVRQQGFGQFSGQP